MGNFQSKKRLFFLKFCLTISFLILSFFLINLFSLKHYHRYLLQNTSATTLSRSSLELLQCSQQQPVEIYLLLDPASELSSDNIQRIKSDFKQLFREIITAVPQLAFHAEMIDSTKEAKDFTKITARFGLIPNNSVIIHSSQQTIVIPIETCYLIKSGKATGFCGEQKLMSAIAQLWHIHTHTLHFLTGHGEYDLDSTHPTDGMALMKSYLSSAGYHLAPLDLSTLEDTLPDNVTTLAIIGPKSSLQPHEIQLLRDWMGQPHHHLLLAIDGDLSTGLDDLAASYGIFIGQHPLVTTHAKETTLSHDIIIKKFAQHPINEKLITLRLPLILGTTCETKKLEGFLDPEKYEITELLLTHENVTEYAPQSQDYMPNKGPFVIATLSEKKSFDAHFNKVISNRLLVLGNADFLSNYRFQNLGNQTMAYQLFSYLSPIADTHTLNISPISIESFHFTLPQSQFNKIIFRSTLPILILVLLGISIAIIRRK